MNLPAILWALLFGLAGGLIVWLWQNWATKRLAGRLFQEAVEKTAGSAHRPALHPESSFKLEVNDSGVTCRRPDGACESVRWNDLEKVEILTTAEGPFLPDVFWVLYGLREGCVIPWGASGEEELLRRLQDLPGFRNEAIVEAASFTTNHQLLCWQRTGKASKC